MPDKDDSVDVNEFIQILIAEGAGCKVALQNKDILTPEALAGWEGMGKKFMAAADLITSQQAEI